MKTDNSNIVAQESLENGYKKYIRGMDKITATQKHYGKIDFTAGAKWQKEQLQPLLESHAELLKACTQMLSDYYNGKKWDGISGKFNMKIQTNISTIELLHLAIEKANNITH